MSALKKEIQTIFNNTTVNQNRVDKILELVKREQIAFAEWILKEGFEKYSDNDICWWGKFNSDTDYTTEQLSDLYNSTK